MPLGLVRKDLNATGVDYRNGNPVPATDASYNSNPVSWAASPDHFGNAVTLPVTYGNDVSWSPAATHFGNILT